ncbi:MAG: formylglycine-generating enzyme family protein [Sphaerospermopsis kisseleviana]
MGSASVSSQSTSERTRPFGRPPGRPPARDMVWIPGGTFQMGSDHHYPEEAPAHQVTVSGFWMDKFTVTNEQFQKFVKATQYVTFAELVPNAADYPGANPEMLVPASLVFQKPTQRVDMRNICNWWQYLPGANWRHPEGKGSSIKGREKHPVVHVAYEDVLAYARWIGKDLPTEAEWEFAARGGLDAAEYVWGYELYPQGKIMANTWQGEFPVENLLTDGYERTAPVGTYAANGYGLHDMAGNVWEWTADWYQNHHAPKACCGSANPKGAAMEQSYDPNLPDIRIPRKVLKGGSYLCAPNYCMRYRPAARIAEPIDTSTCHVGFRLIVRPASST